MSRPGYRIHMLLKTLSWVEIEYKDKDIFNSDKYILFKLFCLFIFFPGLFDLPQNKIIFSESFSTNPCPTIYGKSRGMLQSDVMEFVVLESYAITSTFMRIAVLCVLL